MIRETFYSMIRCKSPTRNLERPYATLLHMHPLELEPDHGVEAGLADERFEALDQGRVDEGPLAARLAPGKDHVARGGMDLADWAVRDGDPGAVEEVGGLHLRDREGGGGESATGEWRWRAGAWRYLTADDRSLRKEERALAYLKRE